MTTLEGLLFVIGWALLRFGLPILITFLLFKFFKHLDEHWQAQAQQYRKRMGVETLVPQVRCWILNNCPEERREKCPAYQQQDKPCWMQHRSSEGQLKEECLECDVFRGVPIPALGD